MKKCQMSDLYDKPIIDFFKNEKSWSNKYIDYLNSIVVILDLNEKIVLVNTNV